MTQFKLIPFSHDSTAYAVTGQISSTFNQTVYSLSLFFSVAGEIEKLYLPTAVDQPRREDELWQTTCFELFLSQDDRPDYQEFNFSPSGNWQSYHFTRYRHDREASQYLTLLRSQINKKSNKLDINVDLEYSSRHIVTKSIQIGVSCILQDLSRDCHYYSLGHPLKADFHNRNFHSIELAP